MSSGFDHVINPVNQLDPTLEIPQLPQALQFKPTFFFQQSPPDNLLEELLSVVEGHGLLDRGNRGTILLGERESGGDGDQDPVLGVDVTQHLVSELALQLRRERVPRPEIAQQVLSHGTRPEGEPPRSGGSELRETRKLKKAGGRKRMAKRREGEVGGGGGGGHGFAKIVLFVDEAEGDEAERVWL